MLESLKPCRCGGKARIRYSSPSVWVECRKKCGMKTGYHRCGDGTSEMAEKSAVSEWNKMVGTDTHS